MQRMNLLSLLVCVISVCFANAANDDIVVELRRTFYNAGLRNKASFTAAGQFSGKCGERRDEARRYASIQQTTDTFVWRLRGLFHLDYDRDEQLGVLHAVHCPTKSRFFECNDDNLITSITYDGEEIDPAL